MRVPVAGRRYYLRASLLAELAVILATYNEAENLTQLVEALEDLREDLQLVVVDDASPDGAGLIAQQLSSRFGNIAIVNRPAKLGLDSALLLPSPRSPLIPDWEEVLPAEARLSAFP